MTRFFYSDPLAAAWMTVHFGLQYISPFTLRFSYSNDNTAGGTANCNKKFYIHPDSLPILDKLSEGQRHALGVLGLWPEQEGE